MKKALFMCGCWISALLFLFYDFHVFSFCLVTLFLVWLTVFLFTHSAIIFFFMVGCFCLWLVVYGLVVSGSLFMFVYGFFFVFFFVIYGSFVVFLHVFMVVRWTFARSPIPITGQQLKH